MVRLVVVLAILCAIAVAAWFLLSWSSRGAVDTVEKHGEALEVLPDDTVVVLVLDVRSMMDSAFGLLSRELGFRLDDEETRADLGVLFEKRVGVDPLKVSSLTYFAGGEGPGILLRGELEFDPSAGRNVTYEGVTMTHIEGGGWGAVVGGGLALGNQDLLRGLIDVSNGKRKALGGTDAGDRHREMAEELGGGALLCTLAPDENMEQAISAELGEGAGVDVIGARLDAAGGLLVMLRADSRTRSMLLKRLDSQKEQLRQIVTDLRNDQDDQDLLTAAGIVLADQHMEQLYAQVEIEEKGDFLWLELDGSGSALSVLLLGAAAAAGPMSILYFHQVRIDSTRAQISNVANHLEMYLYENDEYPASLDVLTRKGRRGRAYLKRSQLRDPWGRDLRYVPEADGFVLCSGGPDGRPRCCARTLRSSSSSFTSGRRSFHVPVHGHNKRTLFFCPQKEAIASFA